MTDPIGWYVRVETGEIADGIYDTVVYIAGYSDPTEAEAAVEKAHPKGAKAFELLAPGILAGDAGPIPEPGEVRLLPGAV